jgi:manganese efflux pump family protein
VTRFLDLVLVALALGADSFRASLGLGALEPSCEYRRRLALSFAMCDGVAVLLGFAVGRSLLTLIGPLAGSIGPLVLAGYALYILCPHRERDSKRSDPEYSLVVLLPLTLSLDNLVAGGMLGSLHFPLLVIALLFGVTSGLMALAGLTLGRKAVPALPLKPDLVGAALLLVASALSLGMDSL